MGLSSAADHACRTGNVLGVRGYLPLAAVVARAAVGVIGYWILGLGCALQVHPLIVGAGNRSGAEGRAVTNTQAAIAAAGTIIVALIYSFFAARKDRQTTLQTGWVALTERLLEEIPELKADVKRAEQQPDDADAKAEKALTRTRRAVGVVREQTAWHERHTANFDKPVLRIASHAEPKAAAVVERELRNDPFPKPPDDL